jgi:endonuclease G
LDVCRQRGCNRRMRTTICFAILAGCSAPAATPTDARDDVDAASGTLDPIGGTPVSPHLQLGVPTDATPDDDYLLVHVQFAESYNRFLNAANWVSWLTTPADFGPAPRYPGPFYPDAMLPAAWFHPDTNEYFSSGYDRGHMVRSEERTQTEDQNIQTFVLTNVLPQTPDLNRGVWFDFELYVQSRVKSQTHPQDAYELAGPVWPAACATHAARVAADGCADLGATADPTQRIAIPIATWKVVVFVPAGEPLATATNPSIVAVRMPNIAGVLYDHWSKYATTVAAIESETGYDIPALH